MKELEVIRLRDMYQLKNSDGEAVLCSDYEELLQKNGGDEAKSVIANNMFGNNGEGSNETGMAQAAITYGLYTAYAQRNNVTMPDDPTNVFDYLDDAEFQKYLGSKEAKADLEGYVAAMNMINDNAQGQIVEDVLINGFNTTDLEKLLTGAKG